MDEEYARKLGAVSGMVHALVKLKTEIGRMRYHPIPLRYTRKLREREAQIAPLLAMYTSLEHDLRSLQSALPVPEAPET